MKTETQTQKHLRGNVQEQWTNCITSVCENMVNIDFCSIHLKIIEKLN